MKFCTAAPEIIACIGASQISEVYLQMKALRSPLALGCQITQADKWGEMCKETLLQGLVGRPFAFFFASRDLKTQIWVR